MPQVNTPEFQTLKEKSLKLPKLPGVYIMRDSGGNIIYIGKAKSLKNRVSGYFNLSADHTEKTRKMVERIAEFDYVVADSEYEALILECSLIKQHCPKYNIKLKDAKGYSYIRISSPPWSRISAEMQISKNKNDGARYIGPYYSTFVVAQTIDEVLKLFKLPQCGRNFAPGFKKSRPCLNHSMQYCCAPCAHKIGEQEYDALVKDAEMYLRSGAEASVSELTSRMERCAENLEFEKAARLRDRIKAIKKIGQKQKVVSSRVKEQDVIAVTQSKTKACFEVFRFESGRLYDREHFPADAYDSPEQARAEFIMSFYSARGKIPPKITLDGNAEDAPLLEQWLSGKAGRAVKITVPQKGEQLELVKMCRSNAAEHLAEITGYTGKQTKALDDLARLLGLKTPPARIEAYDISNTAGAENVGAMVVFERGEPQKREYRKFKIKSFEGPDDYASLHEVLTRRFDQYEEHKGEERGFGTLPDLILMDGGAGQVGAALKALGGRGLDIPVFGMVKDSRHRTRAIAAQGQEISLAATQSAFTLVSKIQNEVHRFAIEYHRQRRKNSTLTLKLTEIEGIGETRAKALLKAFKTVRAISQASPEELTSVKGISGSAARNIYGYFHDGENLAESKSNH